MSQFQLWELWPSLLFSSNTAIIIFSSITSIKYNLYSYLHGGDNIVIYQDNNTCKLFSVNLPNYPAPGCLMEGIQQPATNHNFYNVTVTEEDRIHLEHSSFSLVNSFSCLSFGRILLWEKLINRVSFCQN